MAVDDWYQRQFGDRSTFAIAFSLGRDSHPVGPAERDATWGAVELWVKGRCLTGSVGEDGVQTAVRWSLLPLLQWLVEVGPRLINEDPYPRFSRGIDVADGSAWFDATVSPPVLDPEAENRWFLRRSEWRHFHALRRAAVDVALPNVVFKRLGDAMEISWDNEAWKSARPGLSFVERRGREVVDGATVARVVSDALADVTRSLAERTGLESLGALTRSAEALRAKPHDWRWLVHRPTAELIRTAAGQLNAKLENHVTQNALGLFVPHTIETHLLRLVRVESALELDALLKASNVVPVAPADAELRSLIRPSTAESQRPWDEGNEYADFVREHLGWGEAPLPDLVEWMTDRALVVQASDLGLPASISVLTKRTADFRAAVHVNPNSASRRKRETGWATALGHILLDDAPIAVDGDWEHWPTSARARAFGVALMLPEEGVRRSLAGKKSIGRQEVRELMQIFRTGPDATIYRLKNLRLISLDDMADLGQQLAA